MSHRASATADVLFESFVRRYPAGVETNAPDKPFVNPLDEIRLSWDLTYDSNVKTKRLAQTKSAVGTKAAATKRSILGTNPKGYTAEVKPQWEWHYRTLLRLRQRLLDERDSQRRQVGETLEPHSIHLADTGTDEFDHDLALSNLSSNQNTLYEVDEAIHRILEGTYGVCEATGESIPAARLRAIPWTRLSREAEARIESGTAKHPALGQVSPMGDSVVTDLEEEESRD